MADLKVVLSDPQTGKAYNIDATGAAAGAIIGKTIGTISGEGLFEILGLGCAVLGLGFSIVGYFSRSENTQ